MNVVDRIFATEQAPHQLLLRIHGLTLLLRSNDAPVLDGMRRVYGHYLAEPDGPPLYEIWALDLDPSRYMRADRAAFERYVVASGKAKDPFYDDGEVRYVVKQTTGLCVVFDDRRYVVFGRMEEAANQLNNIINSIHMRAMDERGYTVLHSAGLELEGVGFALAGSAGTGKTTTMLKLVAEGAVFVSNDRLIVRREPNGDWFEMLGVVKWPRVCAGTMHGDPRLRALLPPEAAKRYARMSFDELFGLEEKYDVDVERVYGPTHVRDRSRFRRMYYLAWSRAGSGFAIEPVDLSSDAFWDDFGPGLARDAGVFDRGQRSSRWNDEKKARYRSELAGMEAFVIKGKLDFERIGGELLAHLRHGC